MRKHYLAPFKYGLYGIHLAGKENWERQMVGQIMGLKDALCLEMSKHIIVGMA